MENVLIAPDRKARFLAMLTNSLIFTALVIGSLLLFEMTVDGINSATDYDLPLSEYFFDIAQLLNLVLLWLVCDFPVSTKHFGTIGNLRFKLRVVSKSGGAVSVWRSISRFMVKIPLYIVFITLLMEEDVISDGNIIGIALPDLPFQALVLSALLLIFDCIRLVLNKPTIGEMVSGTRTIVRRDQDKPMHQTSSSVVTLLKHMGSTLPPAERWRRILSMLTNGLVGMVIFIIFLVLSDSSEHDRSYEYGFGFAILTIWLACDFPLTIKFQRNAGHMLLKLRTVTLAGAGISILRSILLSILRIPLYLGLLMLVDIDLPLRDVLPDSIFVILFAIFAIQLPSALISLALNKPTLHELFSRTRVLNN